MGWPTFERMSSRLAIGIGNRSRPRPARLARAPKATLRPPNFPTAGLSLTSFNEDADIERLGWIQIGEIMTSRNILRLATAGLLLTAIPRFAIAQQGPEAKAALAELPPEQRAKTLAFEKSLHPTSGLVQVPGAHASLDLGDQYYFLPADDAKRLLTEAWGNPPDSVSDVLGMVFPRGRSFYDGSWGAVVTYQDSGHIDDKDASTQDYDQVLADMKLGEEESNKETREAGYAGSTTIGWAQAPTYDSANKTLIWARNIKFDGAEENTLNYDVRKLARTGVVSMNMVDSLGHLPLVKTAAVDLGKIVRLDAGSSYADFDSATDSTAEYGLAGLVAAGAGVAVAKKVGLLGIIFLFLKKGIVLVLAAAAGGWAWFKRKLNFGNKEAPVEEVASSAGSTEFKRRRGFGKKQATVDDAYYSAESAVEENAGGEPPKAA